LAAGVLVGFFLFERIERARVRAAILWLLAISGAVMVL
jgi:hypothetical protein